MTDITVTAFVAPSFKGTERELEIICTETVAHALHSDDRPVSPNDVRVLIIDADSGDLRQDVIIKVSDPEGDETKRLDQLSTLKAALKELFHWSYGDKTVATRFRASITSKPRTHAPRPLFGPEGPALNMSLDAAVSRAIQRIGLTGPLDPDNIDADLDQLEASVLGKVGGSYAGQLRGD